MKKIVLALGAIYVVINETTIFQFDFDGSDNPHKIIVRKSGVIPGGEEITKEQLAERLEGKKLLLEGISQVEIESFIADSGVKAEYFLGEPAPIEEPVTENLDEKPVDELPLGNPDAGNENPATEEKVEEPLGESLGNDDDANKKSETAEDVKNSTAATTGGSLEDESGQTTSQENGSNDEVSNTTGDVDGSKDFQGSTNL